MKAGWSNFAKATAAAAAVTALWLSSSTAAAEAPETNNEPDADGGLFGPGSAGEGLTVVDPTAQPAADWDRAIGGYLNSLARTCGVGGARENLAVGPEEVRPVEMIEAGPVAEAWASEPVVSADAEPVSVEETPVEETPVEVAPVEAAAADVLMDEVVPAEVVEPSVDLSLPDDGTAPVTVAEPVPQAVIAGPAADPLIEGASTWAETVVDMWFKPDAIPAAAAEPVAIDAPEAMATDEIAADGEENAVETAETVLQAEATPAESELTVAEPAPAPEVIPESGPSPVAGSTFMNSEEYAELMAAFGGLWQPEPQPGAELTATAEVVAGDDLIGVSEVESAPVAEIPVSPEAQLAEEIPAAGEAVETAPTPAETEASPLSTVPGWWQGGVGRSAWIKAVIGQNGDGRVNAGVRQSAFCAALAEAAGGEYLVKAVPFEPEPLTVTESVTAEDCATVPMPAEAE